mgnify:CR=1 FL=1
MTRLLFLILSLFFSFNTYADTAVKQDSVSGVTSEVVGDVDVDQKKTRVVGSDSGLPDDVILPRQHLSGADAVSVSNWPLVLLTLFGMICLIFALAWFARRFGGVNFSANRNITVVSSLAVGARERVALIDVNGQQFLLGVTTQGISHLHSFSEPVVNTEKKQQKNKVTQSDFADKLQNLLKGGVYTAPSSVTKEEPDK